MKLDNGTGAKILGYTQWACGPTIFHTDHHAALIHKHGTGLSQIARDCDHESG
jgi:hypothetical protein